MAEIAQDHRIAVLTDHPGPHPERVTVAGTDVFITLRREPMTRADWTTHDYNVHFCFGLENHSTTPQTIAVSINGGNAATLPPDGPPLYVSDVPAGPYQWSGETIRNGSFKAAAFHVTLRPGQRQYFANTVIRDAAALGPRFDALAAAGGARREAFGQTLQGRDLVAYHYGDSTQATPILVTSGFHPPEPDTLATEAILESLAESGGPGDEYAITMVPIVNPDGFANGTFAANAAGINFYWHFARELPDRCPEAAALWRLAEAVRPRGYIDFHCYTFQTGKSAGPYERPLRYYGAPDVRRAAAHFYQALLREPRTRPIRGFPSFAPHTLGSMLTKQFDTITAAKFHLHLIEGEAACRARGLATLDALCAALAETDIAGPAPRRHLGWRGRYFALEETWHGLARPLLGRLRRGGFSDAAFTRTALVDPDATATAESP